MTQLPILFPYHKAVQGDGFIAGVSLKGAALVERDSEDDCWWASGVYPCGVSAYGDSPRHAILEVERVIGLLLEDLANSESDFAGFKRSIEAFYNQKGPNTLKEWDAARATVRSGEAKHPNITAKVHDPTFEIAVTELVSEESKPTRSKTAALATAA